MGKTLTLAFLALLLCAPLGTRADTLAQIRAQISAVNNEYGPAVHRHDAAAIAGAYLPDGVLIPHRGTPVRGRAAIARYFAQRLDALDRYPAIGCATQRIAYDGTAVLEEGSCTFTPAPGSRTKKVTGKFLTVWKKDSDGRWRIAINA